MATKKSDPKGEKRATKTKSSKGSPKKGANEPTSEQIAGIKVFRAVTQFVQVSIQDITQKASMGENVNPTIVEARRKLATELGLPVPDGNVPPEEYRDLVQFYIGWLAFYTMKDSSNMRAEVKRLIEELILIKKDYERRWREPKDRMKLVINMRRKLEWKEIYPLIIPGYNDLSKQIRKEEEEALRVNYRSVMSGRRRRAREREKRERGVNNTGK